MSLNKSSFDIFVILKNYDGLFFFLNRAVGGYI